MTFREAYEYALVECNKVKAPSILLEEYVYLFNKAIQQYINSIYNRCEYDQQSSDDLSWLQVKTNIPVNVDPTIEINDTIWSIKLPDNYMHLLNCVAKFTKNGKSNCGHVPSIITPCKRLTSDLYPGIMNNYYMKPTHKNAYYHIINPNNSSNTNKASIYINIHGGTTDWKLDNISISFIKSPQYYTMSYDDLMNETDSTQILEFPDYVCYEIINIFVRLLLENASDPRLQTHLPINQTITSGLTQNV